MRYVVMHLFFIYIFFTKKELKQNELCVCVSSILSFTTARSMDGWTEKKRGKKEKENYGSQQDRTVDLWIMRPSL